ncbi:MAG: universal stress protein [Cyanobacteria bacterium J06632_22]
MYSKILVVMDGFAEGSRPVYGQATRLAKNNRARLRLLHVVPPRQDASSTTEGSVTLAISNVSLWKRFDRRCMELLKRYADQATAQGIYTDYQQVRGPVDTVICDVAREWSADLIVLSHPEAEEPLPDPSILDASILMKLPCSTLFVKPDA